MLKDDTLCVTIINVKKDNNTCDAILTFTSAAVAALVDAVAAVAVAAEAAAAAVAAVAEAAVLSA